MEKLPDILSTTKTQTMLGSSVFQEKKEQPYFNGAVIDIHWKNICDIGE